ncbi:supervillin [Nesidiocoris tenuis]|uniref:Supervillin n=1 Tax=Nesidiocoris tenuis TaxID=355587 RepID=A0ABN7BF70_9HEMI|nr:supervillin [Nesidiocoris tenuis]
MNIFSFLCIETFHLFDPGPVLAKWTVKKSNSSAGEMLGEVTALRRCATQPIPRDEVDDLPKTTIAERLAALRKNGNTNWMKRIEKPIEEIISGKPPVGNGNRLTERMGQLETASLGWKNRVGPQDAQQFTVAGKMSSESPQLPPVPKLGLASRKPTPIVFTNKGIASASVPSVPDSLAELMKRSISVPDDQEELNEGGPLSVKVPQPFDDDFASFFPETDLSRLTSDGDVDLDAITTQSYDLLVHRRTVKVQRKHRSANPIKALQHRTDLKMEYVEVKSGVADREIRRMNIEKLTKNCGLAVEALAGLASKEDITSVSLRKTTEGSSATRQWSHPLLLRVKGRRHPLTSVVRPHYTSINQGDSFVLVTQSQIFHWVGEFCNVIEKSRGADIAQHVESEKDLGCTAASNVITLDGSSFSEKHRQFWKLLSLPDDLMGTYNGENAGHPGEDEVYEKAVSETYMIYELKEDKLVPHNDFWGRCPKIEVLDSAKVLVFDFTTEVYMWAGKNADMRQRKKGTELAQKLFKNVCEAHVSWKPTGIPWLDREMESKSRPEYSVFARITQHMEPIVFKEKFLDWPEFSKVIRSAVLRKGQLAKKVDGSIDARPCDAQAMTAWNLPAPDLVLEGTHLGRGSTYYDTDRMLHFDVTTQELLVSRVHGSTKVPVAPSSVGHFLDSESYVILWKYNVRANARELSGLPSKHSDVGRDRLAYFVWHGRRSPVVDRGAAALLTACPEDPEDAEHGPVITLRQGGENPAFAAMFPGPVVFHDSAYANSLRLFLITGEIEGEQRLEEVEPTPNSLRSRASLMLVDTVNSRCYLWHGAKSQAENRQIATRAVSYLTKSTATELRIEDPDNLTLLEIEEGAEPDEFFGGRGLIDRQIYCSLLDTDINADWSPRLFHLSSIYGEFTASPVVPLRFNPYGVTPYPYSMDDLYTTSQPTLMLLDLDTSLYLWTGWWEGDLDARGSVWGRHGAERIAALTTALHYWDIRGKSPRDVHVVCAGLEPPQFKAAFSVWEQSSPLVEAARKFNLCEGHVQDEMKSAQDELRGLTRTYPASELTMLPLPAGVDPTRLEEYLADQDFEILLGVNKAEFKELASWKQSNLKKKAGLF